MAENYKNGPGLSVQKTVLDEIKTRLSRLYHPKAIYLFGSYAWGSPNDISDIDIAVIVERSNEKPYKRIQRGIGELWDIKKSIDLLVYTEEEFNARSKHPSTLQNKIAQKGIRIYEAS